MSFKHSYYVLIILAFVSAPLFSQSSTFIDDEGIMRWQETNEEICVFGTNYSIPFAYWNQREPLNIDHKKAIDEDVYHIARLGLDGYRIHIWESYISDTLGNLIYNQHFQLFDYLMYKLKQRGIKAYITPMYLSGGNTSFPGKYGGKAGCLTDTSAFPSQENYLSQFISHVNPYTGIAYKDDPDIIAFEIVNEPAHYKRPDLVTLYINRMVDAIRSTGCEKPLMYNMTTAASFIDQILPSKAQGGSFQWYPSGLTSNHDQKGNMLPNVDKYYIPFDQELLKSKRPKFVYEFSPSDIGASSHIYPAMARSFREAGFQFAAHFAYDPLHAAFCNVEYRTHFLNLAYTPKKAIGLMIASEAFHTVPLGKSYGRYPLNNNFESFRLNYENDLAEMVTEQKFLYSNTTNTMPPNSKTLRQVAGTGSSPIVQYSGTGAYFLDKLEDGVWRLEVMPDAHWVKDPFYVPNIEREAAITVWKNYQMEILLPDLGSEFRIEGLNEGNEFNAKSKNKTVAVSPGSYLLISKGTRSDWNKNDLWNGGVLGKFHAPKRELKQIYLQHTAPEEVSTGSALEIAVKVISPQDIEKIELIILGTGGADVISMQATDTYHYKATIPEAHIENKSILRYHISIKTKKTYLTYPDGNEGPFLLDRRIYSDDRHLAESSPYQTRVVNNNSPLFLFDANKDWQGLTKMSRKDKIDLFPDLIPGRSVMHLSVNNLIKDQHNFTVKSYCRENITQRIADVDKMRSLVIHGNSLHGKPCKLQLALLMKDGSGFGEIITLNPDHDFYKLSLKKLKRVKTVLMPRPYPSFQPYWFEPSIKQQFNLGDIESVQISIGPGIPEKDYEDKHGVAIGWINLE